MLFRGALFADAFDLLGIEDALAAWRADGAENTGVVELLNPAGRNTEGGCDVLRGERLFHVFGLV